VSIEELLEEFSDREYTREQFEADRARLVARLCGKHGISESEIDALLREHRYEHSGEDPEDEYMQVMAMGRSAGWLPSRKHAYTCARCSTIYDPSSQAQGHCPGCGRHPHLGESCDHDCDDCDSVRFPPRDGHLDTFQPAGSTSWRRVPRKA
jgi:hypothetical protein